MQTEDMCPATTCFKVMKEKKSAFNDISEDIEIIGLTTCGGCPGNKAVTRSGKMIKRGADTIVFASCIFKGTQKGLPCPHAQTMKDAIIRKHGDKIKFIDYTH